MVDKYSLKNLGHARSPQIKELHKISEENGVGTYSVFTQWPNHPDLDDYLRIGYSPETKEINFIDFDGGPWISKDFMLEDGCVVDHFEHDGNLNNILVIIKDPNFK